MSVGVGGEYTLSECLWRHTRVRVTEVLHDIHCYYRHIHVVECCTEDSCRCRMWHVGALRACVKARLPPAEFHSLAYTTESFWHCNCQSFLFNSLPPNSVAGAAVSKLLRLNQAPTDKHTSQHMFSRLRCCLPRPPCPRPLRHLLLLPPLPLHPQAPGTTETQWVGE